MERINVSGWPSLIGKHIKIVQGDGLVHRIADAFGMRDGYGHVFEACARSSAVFERIHLTPVTDEPVNCFACLSGGRR